jgi:hypothetical protein
MEEEFRSLTAFYLACIQEEGLRRLTLKVGKRGQTFVVPTLSRERLLHEGLEALELSRLTSQRHEFVKEAAEEQGPQTGSGERLFYGFPVWVEDDGELIPLFFREVDLEEIEDGRFRLNVQVAGSEYVNHHLFRTEGYPPEQIVDIQEELEEQRSFSGKLDTALGYLGESDAAKSWRTVEQFPDHQRPGLYAVPILFESTYSSYTYNLEKELGEFQRYNFLREGASETALGPLFRSSLGSQQSRNEKSAEVLPLNTEQKTAVGQAQEELLSAITGPPGTGKSQVVVNLLAEAALSGNAVLFASKNNKAVDVVRERLREILGEKLDFTLRLGAKCRMEAFKEETEDRFRRIEEERDQLREEFSEERREALMGETERIRADIEELRRKREQYRESKKEREEVGEDVPDGWTEVEPPGSPEAFPLAALREILDRARMLAGEARCGILLWLKWALLGDRLLQTLREKTVDLTNALPRAIKQDVFVRSHDAEGYEELLQTLKDLRRYRTWINCRVDEHAARQRLNEALGSAEEYEEGFDALKERLSETYCELLRVSWGGRVVRNLPEVRRRFRRYFDAVQRIQNVSPSGYREALDELESAVGGLSEYLPVWIVTNLSVRNALPLRPALFDLAIIDEASQCDIASAVPLLYRARRSVIIGDPKQLRHITEMKEEEEQTLAQETGAGMHLPRWSYVEQSLYDRAERALGRREERPVFLRRHYRSHPAVIRFSNEQFYQGRLRPMRSADDFSVPDEWKGVQWFHVEGQVPGDIRSAYNQQETAAVLRLLRAWEERGLLRQDGPSVGIVTPFSAQEELIRDKAKDKGWWQDLKDRHGEPPATIGTIHKYQGDERDLMIFSPVVAPGMREYTRRWVAETEQLLNVAVTRARASLQVVGHQTHCRRTGDYLGEFVRYVSSQAEDDALK